MSAASPSGPQPANRLRAFSWSIVAIVAALALWHSAPAIKKQLTQRHFAVMLPGTPQLGFRFQLEQISRQTSLNLRQVVLLAQQAEQNPAITRKPNWSIAWLRTCLSVRGSGENMSMLSATILTPPIRHGGIATGNQLVKLADSMSEMLRPRRRHDTFKSIHKTAVLLMPEVGELTRALASGFQVKDQGIGFQDQKMPHVIMP